MALFHSCLLWAARVIIIAEAFLMAVFSFDSKKWTELLMHLLPPLVLLAAVVFSWRYPLAAFAAFFVCFIVTIPFFKTYSNMFSFLMFSLPLFISSALYLVYYFWGLKK